MNLHKFSTWGALIEQWVSTNSNEDLNINYIDAPWYG